MRNALGFLFFVVIPVRPVLRLVSASREVSAYLRPMRYVLGMGWQGRRMVRGQGGPSGCRAPCRMHADEVDERNAPLSTHADSAQTSLPCA